ncbi:tocopherol cyclase family protein [Bdellovibrionota bacterium FG-2]
MRQLFLALLVFAILSVYSAQADDSADPYNALIWNRENALVGNGKVDQGEWYEWWYYKVVVPNTDQSFYFVYGVVNPWDVEGAAPSNPASRSYVGFGDFSSKIIGEEKFNPRDFSAAYDRTFIQVGQNTATDHDLQGTIVDAEAKVAAKWSLTMEREWSFNAMGWGMFHDWVSNIFWYPAQASAVMSGWVEIAQEGQVARRVELDHAPAYQDRNWGRSFPKWWTWLVSNHFKDSPGTVLTAGGGRPKIFNHVELLSSVIVGFRHEGIEYTFRPNDGDKVKADINFGKWEVVGENREGQRIVISAHAPKSEFMNLPFMTPQGQWFYDYETLKGNIHVQLYKKKGWLAPQWELVADLETNDGGIEYGSPENFDSIFMQRVSLF